MFKGLIAKAVKDMVVDPIMNPKAPQEDESPADEASIGQPRSHFDPDQFDQPPAGSGRFDPDSFDDQPGAARSESVSLGPAGAALDPAAARDIMVANWGIDLPYFPGEGAQCGSGCDCNWVIERSYSPDFGSDCLFATWVLGKHCGVCPDCQGRAIDWAHTFVRPAAD